MAANRKIRDHSGGHHQERREVTPKPEEDEVQLFLDAVRDVKRITQRVADVRSKPPAPAGRQRMMPQGELPHELAPPDESSFVRSGVQTNVLRKLRNGSIPIEGELDLHGYTIRESEEKVRAFLASARGSGRQRAVRIIHGKGLGSPGGKSVLKARTQNWLRSNEAVLAFCPARPEDGGDGALHVLVRR